MRLMSSRPPWIWAHPEWPDLRDGPAALAPALARAHSLYGPMLGRAQAIGLNETHPVALAALSDEMMATAAIEGERLTLEVVHSSVMRRLGLPGSRTARMAPGRRPGPRRHGAPLQRLLDDGDGGSLGGLNADKHMKTTGVSKATATRDLSERVTTGQHWRHGQGKAVRYCIRVPGWTHGLASDPDPTAPPAPRSPEAPWRQAFLWPGCQVNPRQHAAHRAACHLDRGHGQRQQAGALADGGPLGRGEAVMGALRQGQQAPIPARQLKRIAGKIGDLGRAQGDHLAA